MRPVLRLLYVVVLLSGAHSRPPRSVFLFPSELPVRGEFQQSEEQDSRDPEEPLIHSVSGGTTAADEALVETAIQALASRARGLAEPRITGGAAARLASHNITPGAPGATPVGQLARSVKTGSRRIESDVTGGAPRHTGDLTARPVDHTAVPSETDVPPPPDSAAASSSKGLTAAHDSDATASNRTAAGRRIHAGGIVFPDASFVTEPEGAVTPLPTCDGQNVSAISQFSGRCEQLGSAASCPDGQLFLLAADGSSPGCRPLPCPEDELLVGGVCRPADDPLACPAGMALTMDERGAGRCDCSDGHVFWAAERRCYPALARGPCPLGQYLTAPDDEPRPRCAENVCVRDGSLLWMEPPQIGCYPLQAPGAGCGSELQLRLLDGLLVCDRLAVAMRSIFDLPEVRCGSGELMDYAGRCRDPLLQGFRSRR